MKELQVSCSVVSESLYSELDVRLLLGMDLMNIGTPMSQRSTAWFWGSTCRWLCIISSQKVQKNVKRLSPCGLESTMKSQSVCYVLSNKGNAVKCFLKTMTNCFNKILTFINEVWNMNFFQFAFCLYFIVTVDIQTGNGRNWTGPNHQVTRLPTGVVFTVHSGNISGRWSSTMDHKDFLQMSSLPGYLKFSGLTGWFCFHFEHVV